MFTYIDTVVINTTEINSINNSNISIFPNPANDFVNITTKNNGNLQLIDINGKVLINTKVNNNIKIDISDLYNGIYLIKYTTASNIINQKLIIR